LDFCHLKYIFSCRPLPPGEAVIPPPLPAKVRRCYHGNNMNDLATQEGAIRWQQWPALYCVLVLVFL